MPSPAQGVGSPKCTEGESLVSLQFLGFSYPIADSGSTMTGFFISSPEEGRKGRLILASLPQLSEGRGGERTQQRTGPQQTADAALGAWPEAAGQVGRWLSSQLIRANHGSLGNTPCSEGWVVWATFPVIKFLTHPTLVSKGASPRPDRLTATRKTANALVGLLARAWRHHLLCQGHTAKPHQLWIRSHLPTPQPQPCHGRAGSKGPTAFCLAGVSHPAPKCSLNTLQSRSWRPASHTRHTGGHKVQKKTRFPEQTNHLGRPGPEPASQLRVHKEGSKCRFLRPSPGF